MEAIVETHQTETAGFIKVGKGDRSGCRAKLAERRGSAHGQGRLRESPLQGAGEGDARHSGWGGRLRTRGSQVFSGLTCARRGAGDLDCLKQTRQASRAGSADMTNKRARVRFLEQLSDLTVPLVTHKKPNPYP